MKYPFINFERIIFSASPKLKFASFDAQGETSFVPGGEGVAFESVGPENEGGVALYFFAGCAKLLVVTALFSKGHNQIAPLLFSLY